MFSFFKKKPVAPAPAEPGVDGAATAPAAPAPAVADQPKSAMASLWEVLNKPITLPFGTPPAPEPSPEPAPAALPEPVGREPDRAAPTTPAVTTPTPARPTLPTPTLPPPAPPPAEVELVRPPELEPRSDWFGRLRQGLRRTGSGITQVFTGTRIDDALYEELESALLLADAGLPATEFLLADLKRRVKASKATDPAAVKMLLTDALTELLAPLEKTLTLGETSPTVIMVAGVNGAGKTTSIGKLTKHLADAECKVLLAAADTFRAAAREQLAVWADRTRVEIVSQEGGDPSAVTFDAVTAGRARGCDVVIADTAGRLPTQVHLMDELKKIQRTIAKAQPGAPHEVLLVVDGNTGQNALSQVKSFDAALGLTGLIVTKLDGTAKGGVLAAIARWGVQQREDANGKKGPVPVYFVGIGERLQDLQTFNAREFAQALVG